MSEEYLLEFGYNNFMLFSFVMYSENSLKLNENQVNQS